MPLSSAWRAVRAVTRAAAVVATLAFAVVPAGTMTWDPTLGCPATHNTDR